MTAKELIDDLSYLDPNTEVRIASHPGHLNTPSTEPSKAQMPATRMTPTSRTVTTTQTGTREPRNTARTSTNTKKRKDRSATQPPRSFTWSKEPIPNTSPKTSRTWLDGGTNDDPRHQLATLVDLHAGYRSRSTLLQSRKAMKNLFIHN